MAARTSELSDVKSPDQRPCSPPSPHNSMQPRGSAAKCIDSAAGENMNVAVVLDQPGNVAFTNLDEISGRVVVRCPKDMPVDDIVVKLEGESRTRLLSPAGANGEKAKPQLEYHKILYKVAMVHPSSETARNRASVGFGKNAQTLPMGLHEFPFNFKLPFNNSCVHEMTKSPTMTISGSGIEIAKPPPRHVKKTLPPTLTGFPGEAEIRYYVKATVSRHYFWQENARAIVPFNFFPIEPPRPASSGTEIYARQTHSFNQVMHGAEKGKSKMKSFFAKVTESPSSTPATATNAQQSPTITIDARLPEPAILTCNEDIPLRLIVAKKNDFTGILHLQSLQVALVGTTKIRAHDAYRTESSDWVIMSKSNMGIPLGAASDRVGKETVIDDRLWRQQLLPNTVAPTFQTCNIERAYQLDVRVGLSYTDITQSAVKPQSVVLPLRLDLQVYSGIAPPMELLAAMAEARESVRRHSTVGSVSSQGRKQSVASAVTGSPKNSSHPAQTFGEPARAGTHAPLAQAPGYADAPPSYEDAVATGLPPVDGMRPEYAPPPQSGEDDLMTVGDEKKMFRDRRDS